MRFLDGNDDASDTAESRLQPQRMPIVVLIMCFHGIRSQSNQLMTRKLLHLGVMPRQ